MLGVLAIQFRLLFFDFCLLFFDFLKRGGRFPLVHPREHATRNRQQGEDGECGSELAEAGGTQTGGDGGSFGVGAGGLSTGEVFLFC